MSDPARLVVREGGDEYIIFVDDEDWFRVWDYERRSGTVWHRAAHGYAVIGYTYLHRFVMGCVPGDGKVVDHRNGDRLDNRKANLRVGSQSDNMQNIGPHCDSKTGVRGVYPRKGKFIAQWMINGKRVHLGTFLTVDEAAAAVEVARCG